MFTGIIQGTAEIVAIDERTNFRTHTVRLPHELIKNLELGASIAHNGCCLTITHLHFCQWIVYWYDVIQLADVDERVTQSTGHLLIHFCNNDLGGINR